MQVMIGNKLRPEIYDYDTIRGITWLIIGYGRQYFRQSLMPPASTRNRMERKIAFPALAIGLLVKQLSMGMPIIARGIPEK